MSPRQLFLMIAVALASGCKATDANSPNSGPTDPGSTNSAKKPATASATIGGSGGAVVLSSGTAVTFEGGSFRSSTLVTVTETFATDASRGDDPGRTLSVNIGGSAQTDTVLARIEWPNSGSVGADKQLVYAVQAGSGEKTFSWPGAMTRRVAAHSSLTASPTLTAQRSALGTDWYVPAPVGTTTVIRPVTVSAQSRAACAQAYSLEPASGVLNLAADVTIILIHGWQPFLRCQAVNDQELVGNHWDFTTYHPESETWAALTADIRANATLSGRANVFVFRYPTTLSPAENALDLYDRIAGDTRIQKSAGKILIVGHSMGGLVARYLDRLDASGWIGGIVTIGSPHMGAPLASWRTTRSLLPSAGLDALQTNVVNNSIPLPTRSRLHAIRGNLPCTLATAISPSPYAAIIRAVSGPACVAAGALSPGAGVNDGIVPHSSSTPAEVTSSYAAADAGQTALHQDLPTIARVRSNSISKLVEYLPSLVDEASVLIWPYAGNYQYGRAGTALARQLVVQSIDKASGDPVAGVRIAFSEADVSPQVGFTDANGLARFNWTPRADAGEKADVNATTGSASASQTVTFSALLGQQTYVDLTAATLACADPDNCVVGTQVSGVNTWPFALITLSTRYFRAYPYFTINAPVELRQMVTPINRISVSCDARPSVDDRAILYFAGPITPGYIDENGYVITRLKKRFPGVDQGGYFVLLEANPGRDYSSSSAGSFLSQYVAPRLPGANPLGCQAGSAGSGSSGSVFDLQAVAGQLLVTSGKSGSTIDEGARVEANVVAASASAYSGTNVWVFLQQSNTWSETLPSFGVGGFNWNWRNEPNPTKVVRFNLGSTTPVPPGTYSAYLYVVPTQQAEANTSNNRLRLGSFVVQP